MIKARPTGRTATAVVLLVIHALPVIALIIGTKPLDWLVFALLYPIQFAGVGVGLHRYFAHRSFKTSRAFQWLLALMAASAFGDAIRFAGKHRLHHRHADTERDVHTPRKGVWSCWIGSLIDNGHAPEDVIAQARDWLAFPELRWLHRHSLLPGLTLAALAFVIGGFTTMAIGVFLGVVVIIHKSGTVNFLCHRYGTRRFDTPDKSTNNVLVGVLVCGEGWHNNHHRYPSSARHGFAWWEVDVFYWVICLFRTLGLVWAVRQPPHAAQSATPDSSGNFFSH